MSSKRQIRLFKINRTIRQESMHDGTFSSYVDGLNADELAKISDKVIDVPKLDHGDPLWVTLNDKDSKEVEAHFIGYSLSNPNRVMVEYCECGSICPMPVTSIRKREVKEGGAE